MTIDNNKSFLEAFQFGRLEAKKELLNSTSIIIVSTHLLNVQNEEMLIDAPIKNQFFLSGKSSHPSNKQKPQPNQDLTKKRNKQKKKK